MANDYWLPVATLNENSEWNLTAGDVGIIRKKIEEVEAYEDFHENKIDLDENKPWIEIKRSKK